MPKYNKVLVLHSGDTIVMTKNIVIDYPGEILQYWNGDIAKYLKFYNYTQDIIDSASHIELVPVHRSNKR